jgi:hypothetical protein
MRFHQDIKNINLLAFVLDINDPFHTYFKICGGYEECYILLNDRCFVRIFCLHLQGLRVSKASNYQEPGSTQTSMNFNRTTRRHIPEDLKIYGLKLIFILLCAMSMLDIGLSEGTQTLHCHVFHQR